MRRSYTYSLELSLRGFFRDAESLRDFARAHSVARKLFDRRALRVRRRALDQPRGHPDRSHPARDREHAEVELGPHRRVEFARLVVNEHRSHEPVLRGMRAREPFELSPERPVRPMAVVGASSALPGEALALVGDHSRRRRLARQLGGVGERQADVGVPFGLAALAALLAAPVADEAEHPSSGDATLAAPVATVAGHVTARSRTGVRFERAARRRIGVVEGFEQQTYTSYTFGEVGHYHFLAHRASADRTNLAHRAGTSVARPIACLGTTAQTRVAQAQADAASLGHEGSGRWFGPKGTMAGGLSPPASGHRPTPPTGCVPQGTPDDEPFEQTHPRVILQAAGQGKPRILRATSRRAS